MRSSRLLLAVSCLLLTIQASAQSPVTVTGLIKTPTNIAASFGTVTFKLQPFNSSIAYRVAGQVMIGPIQSVCGIDASGHLKSNADLVSACQVWGNDVISPTGTAYEVIESPNNGPGQDFTNALIQGASLDLSNLTFVPNVRVFPDLTSLTLSPLTVSLIPNADNLYSLGSGGDRFSQAYINNAFINNLSSIASLNNEIFAQPSGDGGQSLNNAIALAPATGAIINACQFTANQAWATQVAPGAKPIWFKFCPGTITYSSASAFLLSAATKISCAGEGLTTFLENATGKPFISATSLTGLEVSGCTLQGAAGTSGLSSLTSGDDAIFLNGASLGNISAVSIHDNEFSGWGLNGVRVAGGTHIDTVHNHMHGISEGVRYTGVQGGSIIDNDIHDCNLTTATFTVSIGLDAFSASPAHNSDIDVTDNHLSNCVSGEALMLHDGTRVHYIGNIVNNWLYPLGIGTSDGSSTIADWSAVGNSFTNAISTGVVGVSNYNIGVTSIATIGHGVISGNTLLNGNAALAASGQGGIALGNCDDVIVANNTIRSAVDYGIAMNSTNPCTRLSIRNNNITNVVAATHQVGIGVTTGASTGYTGRVEGNTIDAVAFGISAKVSSAGLNLGPNDITNASSASYETLANFTANTTFPGSVTSAGAERGSQQIADQGTICTNGELALSAGWQSTGSATVTGVVGTGQTCEWTITTGTTTAANPTVTDTLTNALPSANTVCWMIITGGNRTAAAADSFDQTTLSATAPIFTFQGTPTAGGKTYKVVRTCGP